MAWSAPNPVASTGFTFREGEDEYDLKMQFAAIVARDRSKGLMAGYELFKGPENYGRAMQAQLWLTDPTVQNEIARLIGPDGASSVLRTKDEILKEIEDIGFATKATDPKTSLAAFELRLKANGDMTTPGEGSGNTINIQNVIKLPHRIEGPQEEALFEARFEAQQLKLVKDARSNKSD